MCILGDGPLSRYTAERFRSSENTCEPWLAGVFFFEETVGFF
jgi:hypothetical protein